MKTVPLKTLIKPAGSKAGNDTDLPVYSVTKHAGFVPSMDYFKKQVFSRELSGYKRVQRGDFAYATIHLDEGSIGIAPDAGLISPMYTVFRTDIDAVEPQYLLRYMKSPAALAQYPRFGKGSVHRRKSISLAALGELAVPLPPLAEQRRIAAILDHADNLRALNRKATEHLTALSQALFVEYFGDDLENPTARLEDLASVSSGITKGRRTSDPTRPVPYLAVANVQAGYLALDLVKEIDATDVEIARYALAAGDLVLTEGGDPDKLGRGTLWRSELPLCLHQNHIFRVRVSQDAKLEPEYLSAFMASRTARSYFLRAAKQTTGIASINMTQLRSLPVFVPPIADQRRYLDRVAATSRQMRACAKRSVACDTIFASLQSRAFSGQL